MDCSKSQQSPRKKEAISGKAPANMRGRNPEKKIRSTALPTWKSRETNQRDEVPLAPAILTSDVRGDSRDITGRNMRKGQIEGWKTCCLRKDVMPCSANAN